MRFVGAVAALAIAASAVAGEIPRADRRSGYEFMSRQTRAMQDDDTANPGMLWVLEGGTLWEKKTGAAGRACADCHGDPRASMKGVAARYPAFDAAIGRPISLEQRINRCRIDRQQAPALAYESRELLAMTAFVARQSRGLPIDVTIDARTHPFLDAGRATFHRRQGQLNLARAGRRARTGASSSSIPNTADSRSSAMRLPAAGRARETAPVVADLSSSAWSTWRSTKNSSGLASRRMPTPYRTAATCLHTSAESGHEQSSSSSPGSGNSPSFA